MEFEFTKHRLVFPERWLQRAFEILPGAVSWSILILLSVCSIFMPIGTAILIIAFDLYWLLKLLYMTIFLILSYYWLKIEKGTDWMARAAGIDRIDDYLDDLKNRRAAVSSREFLSLNNHIREVQQLKDSRQLPPPSEKIHHVIIYPILKESREVVEPCIKSLRLQQFPTERMIVIFALEERAQEAIKQQILALEKKYKPFFHDVMTVLHPSDVPGEARVKGANVTHAAKTATRYLEERKIPFDHVVVSCFDADTVVSPDYFACLTYHYMVTPTRIQSSFQPIPVYHNNIWRVPGFARVIETGSSFFQLIEATNPEKLVTFSSHSMSFRALVEVGYWPVDLISDDSAIYWKSLIYYDGKYRVVPIYVTLSMDVAEAETFWKTAKSVYKQKRRWAWGVENFPIVMRAFLKAHRIPLYDRLRYAFKLFEGHVSWATWGFILTLVGWFPILFAQKDFSHSVVYFNAPHITGIIFNLASLSLVISIVLSIGMLPKRQIRHSFLHRLGFALEWLMIPVILLVFSSLPALDAQTRLMLGRYMEFWVTDKQRHQNREK